MSAGGGSGRGRRRALTPEERDLWRAVTRHDKPLKSDARRAGPAADPNDPTRPAPRAEPKRAPAPPPSDPHAPPPHPRTLRPHGQPEPPVSIRRAPSPIDPLSPATPGLDRNTARRLRKGQIDPDARIDLHGMTAERAHRALLSFMMREHAAGSRCVLVITGKGGRRQDRDGYEMREVAEGAGVLKSLTPHWLATPPLSGLVVGVYQANIRHGGGGALYVYLKKPRR